MKSDDQVFEITSIDKEYQSNEHHLLVNQGDDKLNKQKAFTERVNKSVVQILDGDNGVLGPTYDKMNARLFSIKNDLREVEHKDLIEFKKEKDALRE